MRRWITRLLDCILIGCGFRETPKHFDAFVWHRTAERPVRKEPHHVEFFSEADWARIAAEDAAFALSLQDTRKVTGEQTARYKTLPRWVKS